MTGNKSLSFRLNKITLEACGYWRRDPKGCKINRSMIGFPDVLTCIQVPKTSCLLSVPVLEAFSDSDYGGASLDRKSTTGGLSNYWYEDDNLACKKQTIVANSTTEAEYVAAKLLNNQDLDNGWKLCPVISLNLGCKCLQTVEQRQAKQVAFLKKPTESEGFPEIVDFQSTSLRYALTHNLTIYDSLVKQFWQTATIITLANGTPQLITSIDYKEYTITEASVRSKLQLAYATGIHNLSDAAIYVGLAILGYVTEGDIVPLLPAMLAGAAMDQGEGSAQPVESNDQLEWVLWYAPWLSDQLEWNCGMLHGLVVNWSSFAIEKSRNRVNVFLLITVSFMRILGLREVARTTARIALEFANSEFLYMLLHGFCRMLFDFIRYWRHNSVPHCIDFMHVEKNVAESLVRTLLHVPEKMKDGVNARLDLAELGGSNQSSLLCKKTKQHYLQQVERELTISKESVSETVRWISYGPRSTVVKYDVLDYHFRQIPLFKYDWVNHRAGGVKRDNFRFCVLVNLGLDLVEGLLDAYGCDTIEEYLEWNYFLSTDNESTNMETTDKGKETQDKDGIDDSKLCNVKCVTTWEKFRKNMGDKKQKLMQIRPKGKRKVSCGY
ncbi:hypothetical protein Tco_0936841 [Tanacetum coccineum]|uniref:Uncharacterized protein n=1 Tax=Tanacetum coccineum TaxID=301880 RepID=A0ABQ5DFD1_9ASTR